MRADCDDWRGSRRLQGDHNDNKPNSRAACRMSHSDSLGRGGGGGGAPGPWNGYCLDPRLATLVIEAHQLAWGSTEAAAKVGLFVMITSLIALVLPDGPGPTRSHCRSARWTTESN